MSSPAPSDLQDSTVVVKNYMYRGHFRGLYRGTVNSSGQPHGRGDFDGKGKYAEVAFSGYWVNGKAANEGWMRYPAAWDGGVYAGGLRRGYFSHGRGAVSYTHLTLPTIYSV